MLFLQKCLICALSVILVSGNLSYFLFTALILQYVCIMRKYTLLREDGMQVCYLHFGPTTLIKDISPYYTVPKDLRFSSSNEMDL